MSVLIPKMLEERLELSRWSSWAASSVVLVMRQEAIMATETLCSRMTWFAESFN